MILQKYKEQLDQQGVLLSYYGPMRQNLVEGFGDLLRQQLSLEKEKNANMPADISHKVFHIFIEQAQNIARYSAEQPYLTEDTDADFRNGIFIIGNTDNFYYVECCNLVTKARGEKIITNLEQILNMDQEQLKQLYRKSRRGKTPDDSVGAGLGFIDMARHSTKMEYEVNSIDATHSFFSLKVYI